MRVVIIGGSGFIGTRLVEYLQKTDHDARIFDKNPSSAFNGLVTLGDVRDQHAISQALRGVDVVYNLAAEHADDVRPVSLYYDVNVQGAKNIVQAAERNGVKKIVFTSTVAVYGLNKPNPDENNPTEPFNDYGKSKLEAEIVFNQWAEKGDGRSLVIVRPTVIFGEGNEGNVYTLINQIASKRFIMVGHGHNRKSMGYVGNLVDFLIRAAEFGEGTHLFNYADKPDMSVRELVNYIRQELGILTPLPVLPYLLGLMGGYSFDLASRITGKQFSINSIRIRKFYANTTVSTSALESIGFKPVVSLQEGLSRMMRSM